MRKSLQRWNEWRARDLDVRPDQVDKQWMIGSRNLSTRIIQQGRLSLGLIFKLLSYSASVHVHILSDYYRVVLDAISKTEDRLRFEL